MLALHTPEGTLADVASTRLTQAIITGELLQGQKLNEADLAERYGIGRGPLREALRQLEGMRLVKRIPHAGARVVMLDRDMMADLYAVREALEGMACRTAALRMTDAEIETLRVLLVDDSKMSRRHLRRLLEELGIERITEAEDGKQGLDVLKTETVDVVITDINMPVMDGIEFIKNVRATGNHQSLPILILTTETSQDKRDQGKAAGGTGWIVKPFDPEKLISVIHRVVH